MEGCSSMDRREEGMHLLIRGRGCRAAHPLESKVGRGSQRGAGGADFTQGLRRTEREGQLRCRGARLSRQFDYFLQAFSGKG